MPPVPFADDAVEHECVALDRYPPVPRLCVGMTVADETDDETGSVLLTVGHEDAAGQQDVAIGTGSTGGGRRVVHLDETEHALLSGHGVESERSLEVEKPRAFASLRGEVPRGERIREHVFRKGVRHPGRAGEGGHGSIPDCHLVVAAQHELRQETRGRGRDDQQGCEVKTSSLHGYH